MRQLLFFCFCLLLESTATFAQKAKIKSCLKQNGISFDFRGEQVVTRSSFDLNTMVQSSGDTLALVTCSDYVYFPFGNLTAKSNFKKTPLSGFQTIEKRNKDEDGFALTQVVFASKQSKLLIQFDNDSEASKHSYVASGEIKDSQVTLGNHIRVGMATDQFCSVFFSSYPKHTFDQVRTIIFESCVTDIAHVYTFEDQKLASVRFIKQ